MWLADGTAGATNVTNPPDFSSDFGGSFKYLSGSAWNLFAHEAQQKK
jgi:hypothetical protein